ncbi:alpha/beta hydrolase [Phycicoccus sp. 3266]|uniref:alpha/beta hydrolase n=1 Tax=Phycicoccus sp. 3266 TaxID=2817751 RepID=UPI002859A8EA|nr:alpha/beta hydrolase [Phycicoccus sp. 3266]MDR6863977.1 pimeloyl-ACP methyl ester carboxylesterase [Phycicoccus sp. 3266]
MSIDTRHLRRARWSGLAAAALVALLPVTASLVTSGQTSRAEAATRHAATGGLSAVQPARAPQDGSKPTIVLIHGAFADASGWTQEVVSLQRQGYDVIAPANPLRGLTSDSDYVRSVLATTPGPVVLVGHSYGGAVITNAARGAENVKALVYVAAFVPDAGQAIVTSYDPAAYPGSLLGPDTTLIPPAANPAAPGGQDLDVYIKPASFRTVFAGDRSPAAAAAMAATQRPLSYFAQTEPSGQPAWKNLPSWDLVTMQDRAISPGGQLFMARRAGATVSTVDSAHDVIVSHPQDVVDVILQAARAVG